MDIDHARHLFRGADPYPADRSSAGARRGRVRLRRAVDATGRPALRPRLQHEATGNLWRLRYRPRTLRPDASGRALGTPDRQCADNCLGLSPGQSSLRPARGGRRFGKLWFACRLPFRPGTGRPLDALRALASARRSARATGRHRTGQDMEPLLERCPDWSRIRHEATGPRLRHLRGSVLVVEQLAPSCRHEA